MILEKEMRGDVKELVICVRKEREEGGRKGEEKVRGGEREREREREREGGGSTHIQRHQD